MFNKLFVSSFVGISLAFIINIYLPDIIQYYFLFTSEDNVQNDQEKLFTIEKLSQYNGQIKEELYLSILGEVFDVTKGKKHYGPGESYHAFIGRDASQLFITGEFDTKNTVVDDVTNLSGEELISLKKWKEFYNEEYVKKGKLIGRYYDSNGNPTDYTKNIDKLIEETKVKQNTKEMEKKLFPPCNVAWDKETGTRVWCTEKSGGIERDWVGYPVKFYEPGSNSFRCACVKSYEDKATIKQYDDCHLKTSCIV